MKFSLIQTEPLCTRICTHEDVCVIEITGIDPLNQYTLPCKFGGTQVLLKGKNILGTLVTDLNLDSPSKSALRFMMVSLV